MISLGTFSLILGSCFIGISCQQVPSESASTHTFSDTIQSKTSFIVGGFDFPVGPPDGKRYYNAQPFGKNYHLGDDWNGVGGGNSDLGDSVFSIANGVVSQAYDAGAGWGNVVRVIHHLAAPDTYKNAEALYAHLLDFDIAEGDTLLRGQFLGRIGNAQGAYLAHLHLEIRTVLRLPLGGGYSMDTSGYINPTRFIRERRPHSP